MEGGKEEGMKEILGLRENTQGRNKPGMGWGEGSPKLGNSAITGEGVAAAHWMAEVGQVAVGQTWSLCETSQETWPGAVVQG